MRSRALLLLALFATITSVTHAIIVAGGDGSQQISEPTSGPALGVPWNYVGTVNGLSGVFLGDYNGNYWVLTASHVVGSGSSLGNFIGYGGTYTFVPGSGVVVTNADSTPTDLTLFRISAGPALSNLTLASSAPIFGSTVTLIGYGVTETTSQVSYWNVTGSGAGTIWNVLGGSSGSNAFGYPTGGGGAERWGLGGTINPTSVGATAIYNVGTGNTQSILTEFVPTVGSAQAGVGDSGGAMFFDTGSGWELAGILGAVGLFDIQPPGTAIFGQVTYAGSIANYNSAILSDISAIPEPADFAAWSGALALGIVFWRRRRRA
jgi:hypothetical protein